MSRLIDADALEELFREVIWSLSRKTDCNLNFEYMIRSSAMTIEMIKDAPTIIEFEGDINKVVVKGEEYHRTVRCKDCKYMTEHYDTDGNVPYWICSEWDSGTDYDGFCHLAERRSDD